MAARGRSAADAVLVAALASGATQREAAEQAGVSERTVRRRLDDDDFRSAVEEARREMVAQAVAHLSGTATDAAKTLRALLKARSEHARLGAARAVLDYLRQHRAEVEVEERIAELERRAREIEEQHL
jgi:DNA-binding LacI/PurR family transcriptional regulator